MNAASPPVEPPGRHPGLVFAVFAASAAFTAAMCAGAGPMSRAGAGPTTPPPEPVATRASASPPGPTTTARPALPTIPPSDVVCDPAAPGLVGAIMAAATGGAAATGRAITWRVPYSGVWLVAVELSTGAVGVWATNEPAGGGLVYAVDAVAQDATTWPAAASVALRVSPDDPMAREVRSCLAGWW